MTSSRPLLALLAAALGGGAARAEPLDTAELYAKVVKSCVYIITPLKGGFATGSGSLIDVKERIVLTNQHVVDENEYVFVQFPIFKKDGSVNGDKDTYMAKVPENKAIRGKVLHRDHTRDLAFVKLDSVPEGVPAIPLARKGATNGTKTWNIGSPGAVPQLFSITEGRVRTVGLTVMNFGGGKEVKAMVVTATNPVNPGDSGGPLFNDQGQQVAVTQSLLPGAQLVTSFIDVSEVRTYLKERKIEIKEQVGADGKTIEAGKPAEKAKDPATPADPPKDTKIKTPPAVEAVPPKAAPPAKVEPTGPSAADEAAAAKRLNYAKAIGSSSQERYVELLTEVIKKWPGTKAAKEAGQLKAAIK